jgi:hypothetical protein
LLLCDLGAVPSRSNRPGRLLHPEPLLSSAACRPIARSSARLTLYGRSRRPFRRPSPLPGAHSGGRPPEPRSGDTAQLICGCALPCPPLSTVPPRLPHASRCPQSYCAVMHRTARSAISSPGGGTGDRASRSRSPTLTNSLSVARGSSHVHPQAERFTLLPLRFPAPRSSILRFNENRQPPRG